MFEIEDVDNLPEIAPLDKPKPLAPILPDPPKASPGATAFGGLKKIGVGKLHRARRSAAGGRINAGIQKLITALEFVSHNQTKNGPTKDKFCRIQDGWVYSNNGIISLAHPVESDSSITVHTTEFLRALKQAKSDVAITELENTVVVTSGESRVVCHLMPGWLPPGVEPDQPALQVDNRLSEALLAAASAAVAKDERLVHTCVRLASGSCVATNGQLIAEAWHGFELPVSVLLPARAVAALEGQTLVNVGGSESSVTFYLENGAWMKTQLLNAEFPKYEQVFETQPLFFVETSAQLQRAIKTVASFGKEALFTFCGEDTPIDQFPAESTFQVSGLTQPMQFYAHTLRPVADYLTEICLSHDYKDEPILFFRHGNVRGAAMGTTEQSFEAGQPDDDNIPF